MYGHFIYSGGKLENAAADIVINAAISRIFSVPSGSGSLFSKFYAPLGLEGLLRPDSDMHGSRYRGLYDRFYGTNHGRGALSTGEVINTLRILTPEPDVQKVPLLGGHEGLASNGGGELSSELKGRIAEDFRRIGASYAGSGDNLYEQFVETLKCHLAVKKRLLDRFTTRRKVDAFVKPHMDRYLQRINDELGPGLREKPFLVMQSSGGVISSAQVVNKPITTALSGPAAGAPGSSVIARIAGFENAVTLDPRIERV